MDITIFRVQKSYIDQNEFGVCRILLNDLGLFFHNEVAAYTYIRDVLIEKHILEQEITAAKELRLARENKVNLYYSDPYTERAIAKQVNNFVVSRCILRDVPEWLFGKPKD